jgi:hypothetical protein
MELKEIFRHKEGQLFPALHMTHDRYNKLRDVFVQFIGRFPPGKGDNFPEGLDFQVDKAMPTMSVTYCGVEYRFLFDVVSDQGRVRCTTLPLNASEDEEPEELGTIEFNGKGITDIKTPDEDSDEVELVDGAYYVVANFLLAPYK